MSLLAIVLATGTAAWGFGLPRNSVRSANIVNGQVKTRDLAHDAVTGAKVAHGSLTTAQLRRGVASPGPTGPRGATGRVGDDGAPGAPAVDRQRLTLADPGDVGIDNSFALTPGVYGTEPGDMLVYSGTVTATLTSGSCGGASHLAVYVANFSSAVANLAQSGTVNFSGGGFVDPAGAATRPVTIETSNSCGGAAWHLDAVTVDLTHVH